MQVPCSASKHHKSCPLMLDTDKDAWVAKVSSGHTFYTNYLCLSGDEPELIPISEEAKDGIRELISSAYSIENMPGWAKEVLKSL